jgi:hypothetical protein
MVDFLFFIFFKKLLKLYKNYIKIVNVSYINVIYIYIYVYIWKENVKKLKFWLLIEIIITEGIIDFPSKFWF